MGQQTYGGEGPLIMGIVWLEFSLSSLMVLARYYTNKVVIREFAWDFWWACATLFFGLVSQICITVAVAYGLGNENSHLPAEASATAILWTWLGQSLCIFAIALSKLVVISFLLRVQGGTSRWGTYFLWFLAVTNVFINVFETVLVMFQCSPTWKLWRPETPGDCYVRDHVNIISGYLQGAWNAVSDVCLAIYPAVIFYSVQMPLRIKIGVSALMATGLFAAACAAAKTWEIRETHVTEDVTVALTSLTLLNWSELWITLLAASIPAIWPLISHARHRRTDAYRRQHNPSTNGHSRSRGSFRSGDRSRDRSPNGDLALESDFAAAPMGKHQDGYPLEGSSLEETHDDTVLRHGSLEYTDRARTPSLRERAFDGEPQWNQRSTKGSTRVSVETGQAV